MNLFQPLSVGKSSQRILVKNPKSKEIEPSHTFSINEVGWWIKLYLFRLLSVMVKHLKLKRLQAITPHFQIGDNFKISFSGVHLAVPQSEDSAGKR